MPSGPGRNTAAADHRFDRGAAELLAEKMPGLHVVLIGPISPMNRRNLQARANIHALGAIEYGRLPGFLQHADLGLLPLSDHPKNRGRSPMKLFEYAAAGLPVVARSASDTIRRNESFVRTYADPSEIVSKVARILQGEHAGREDIRELARAHSWKAKADVLLDFVNSLTPGVQNAARQ